MLEKRKILEENLFLQVFGSGRDYNPLTAENAGDEVGKRLAGSGAGLNAQVMALIDCLSYRLGHLYLPRAELILQVRAGNLPLRAQDSAQFGL